MFSTRAFFFLKLKEEKSTQEIERTGKKQEAAWTNGRPGRRKKHERSHCCCNRDPSVLDKL
jgi:hypothetical protein